MKAGESLDIKESGTDHTSSHNQEKWDSVEQGEKERRAVIERKIGKVALENNIEDPKLLKDMLEARSYFDRRQSEKIENIHNQRAQEIFERELNDKLTTKEDLFDAVRGGADGIEISSKQYEDAWIPVISLQGYPYAMLTHTVDYRGKPGANNNSGRETAWAVLDDPSIWAEGLEEAKNNFVVDARKDSRGNVISASYTNSEHNLKTSFIFASTEPELTYGFDGVGADTVLKVTNGDGMTPNLIGDDPTKLNKENYLNELEQMPDRGYNEVTLRRYDDKGQPKIPDYLVVLDGRITETVLKHAKYFDIPIVDIKTSIYEQKQKAKASEILSTIDSNEPYPEFRKKVDKLYGLDSIGIDPAHKKFLGWGEPTLSSFGNPPEEGLGKDLNTIEVIDSMRSLDYVKNQLQNQIQKINEAFERGDSTSVTPEGFESFKITMTDMNNRKEKEYNSYFEKEFGQGSKIEDIRGDFGPEARSSIRIVFKPKDSPRETDITLEDGEHPIGGVQYAQSTADSHYYDSLAPIVNEYLDLLSQHGL